MNDDNSLFFLDSGPANAPWRLILAHGAGAPMDSPFMQTMAEELGQAGIGVSRFEFPYMVTRRETGKKKPPDRAPKLLLSWRQAVDQTADRFPGARIAVGGKSMGGRMATLLAAEPDAPPSIQAVVTLGYPFHPPGKPETLRTDHFGAIPHPVLMIQGTRDPFGKQEEVTHYKLPDMAAVFWSEDGDHDLKPRKASGRTHPESLSEAVDRITNFLSSLPVSIP